MAMRETGEKLGRCLVGNDELNPAAGGGIYSDKQGTAS